MYADFAHAMVVLSAHGPVIMMSSFLFYMKNSTRELDDWGGGEGRTWSSPVQDASLPRSSMLLSVLPMVLVLGAEQCG